MNDLKAVIADDDAGMRLVMRKILGQAPGYAFAGEAGDGETLMSLYDACHPDVVILDVEMPGLSGIECAKRIQDANPKTVLIFATAHEKYRGDAFEVYAFDYLMKPFKVERVLKTLELVRSRLNGNSGDQVDADTASPREQTPTRLMIRHRDGVAFVDLKDLLLAQREDRATVLYTASGQRFVTGETLGDLEERLPKDAFFRSHKSYIINLGAVKSVSPYGRWTYVIKLEGTEQDALITHEKFEEMQKRFA
ncbi:MAG: response regulator transcription factor [Clostridia bacterium]|nr:response regulator transcription factor [Clostridia bacterium]